MPKVLQAHADLLDDDSIVDAKSRSVSDRKMLLHPCLLSATSTDVAAANQRSDAVGSGDALAVESLVEEVFGPRTSWNKRAP